MSVAEDFELAAPEWCDDLAVRHPDFGWLTWDELANLTVAHEAAEAAAKAEEQN